MPINLESIFEQWCKAVAETKEFYLLLTENVEELTVLGAQRSAKRNVVASHRCQFSSRMNSLFDLLPLSDASQRGARWFWDFFRPV